MVRIYHLLLFCISCTLHFRNVRETDAIKFIKEPVWETVKGIAYAYKLDEIQVNRKTVMDEVNEVVKNHGFTANRTEKWISESLKKVLKFQNKAVPMEKQPEQKILELIMDKHDYQKFRMEDVISVSIARYR